MATEYIYDQRGTVVGYRYGSYIHDMSGRAVGQVSGTHVHKMLLWSLADGWSLAEHSDIAVCPEHQSDPAA
jgi:hypothetical protein